MNTLLGELATLNDVQFPRYRVALKFRKLQKSFLLDHADVTGLQEVLHTSGVQGFSRDHPLPLTQVKSVLGELYTSIRAQYPVLTVNQLNFARDCCLNWLQMAYKCSAGHSITAGALSLTLCLFSGSRLADKTRYLFTLLANDNGAVERGGLHYFCKITRQLAECFQEQLYSSYESLNAIFMECLVFVRSAEDVEDEEWDGGIKRQLLSQFELIKTFTADPEPAFLSWFALWHKLLPLERVVHPVRCAICTRKPIVQLRYQCMHCPNFHMCQMCFLKGRTTPKHPLSHKVIEFTAPSRGVKAWHRWLGGQAKKGPGSRVMVEPRQPFVYSSTTNGSSFEDTDTALSSLMGELLSSPQTQTFTSQDSPSQKAYGAAVIRIGSNGLTKEGKKASTISSPKKDAHHTIHSSPARRVFATSSSSPDSLSSCEGGGKFNFDRTHIGSANNHPQATSQGSLTGSTNSSDNMVVVVPVRDPPPVGRRQAASVSPARTKVEDEVVRRRIRVSTSDSSVLERNTPGARDLSEVNRRLSMEVDQLLQDLPPAASSLPTSSTGPLIGSLGKLREEQSELQTQFSQLADKRTKLSSELQGLMSQLQTMHCSFADMSHGIRTPSVNSLTNGTVPLHVRMGSGPAPTHAALSMQSQSHRSGHLPTIKPQLMVATGYNRSPPPGATDLLDPLVDFTPSQLEPGNYRLSVAW